ncbi:MAG TPA: hypothetical protein PKA00_04525 [Saprospiraceae bacterium]|nr:hypothetical protein [Saprospiraceae bacterium]HMQ82145.1 hypothetical protein [Saprospiraceae bacterium]
MFSDVANGVSSLISLVPFPDKFTFIPLRETDPIPIPSGLPFSLMFNPEQFSEQERYLFNTRQAPGQTGAQQRFLNTAPKSFSFEFTIDGTGGSGEKKEVELSVASFKKVVGFNGDIHRPNFLLAIWGTFISTCVLTSMDVTYTMFRKNGTPLRAKVRVSFAGHTKRLLELLSMNLLSPDLTHFRTVVEGDTLPLLSYKVYESPRYYLEIAKVNGLTSPRQLKRGQELRFPPIEK